MAETFGNTVKGPSSRLASGNTLGLSKYKSGSAGDLVSITIYVNKVDTGKIKCAIYDASFDLLPNGETEVKDTVNYAWMTFNFSTKPHVDASTDYYLAWWIQESTNVYRNLGVPDISKDKSVWFGYNDGDPWPDPISGLGDLPDEYPIYATYEEPPPAVKTLVQAALISIPPLIVLPTLGQILKVTGGC